MRSDRDGERSVRRERGADGPARTVGVEEELLLVDPATGEARAVASAAIAGGPSGAPEGELKQEQVEVGTRVCRTLAELDDDVRHQRRVAAEAAREAGAEVAALATSPQPVQPTTSPDDRYQRITAAFGLTGEEQLTCGCHVHVAIGSADEGVAVLDRIRGWLPPLLALSANSPFWQGRDSGYGSYRNQVWGRWPSAGPTGVFGSARGYRDTVAELLATDTIVDEAMVYFDARLSARHPTVEVRVADVCLLAEDAVVIGGLVRGLVETAAREWRDDRPAPAVRTELLRMATWRAARSGVTGDLVDPRTGTPAPAAAVLDGLVEHVGPVLAEIGDADRVADGVAEVLRRGTGAQAQRAASGGGLAAVVAEAVSRTLPE